MIKMLRNKAFISASTCSWSLHFEHFQQFTLLVPYTEQSPTYFLRQKLYLLISFLIFQASYRETGCLTGRLGLSQGGQASHRKTGHPNREARSLTGRPGLSQGLSQSA